MNATSDPHALANGDLVNRVQQLRLGDQLGAAKRPGGGSWLPWVLCGLLAVTWAGVGIRSYKAGGPDRAGEGPATAPVAAGSGSPRPQAAPSAPGEIMFTLKGNLIPSLQIAVSPVDVAGEVTEIRFKEGDRVRQGDVLARLRDTRYRNEHNTAVATYEAAVQRKLDLLPGAVREAEKAELKAQWAEAEANRVQAAQELERVKAQRATGSNSPQDVEKAVANLAMAEARVDRTDKTYKLLLAGARKERVLAAEADIAAAKARMEEAKRLLDNCVIKAPITGTVLTKKADIGSLVSPAAFNVAASLCEVADLSRLEAEVDVPERQITKVRERMDCQLTADANPDRVYRGYVDRIMPIADDSKNVIKVRVRVVLPRGEPAGSFLKPKMSVTVTAYNRDFVPDPAKDQPWN
jgi:multidrug resistance efflux pump